LLSLAQGSVRAARRAGGEILILAGARILEGEPP